MKNLILVDFIDNSIKPYFECVIIWKRKTPKNEAENENRKKVTLEDIMGMVDGPKTDAVELKRIPTC